MVATDQARLTLLQQLAASAALLPTLTAFAEEVPEPSVSFGYHSYKEDSIQTYSNDEMERYDIDVYQARIVAPVSKRKALRLDFVMDSMTGSSPWFSRPDASDGGDPDVVSSPSIIEDTRYDINGSITDYGESEPGQPQFMTAWSFGVSQEDDYLGLSTGLANSYEFWGRNLRLSWGGDINADTISPESISGGPTIEDQDKKRWNIFTSLAWVATPETQLSVGIATSRTFGFLTDPYKRVYILDIAGGISTPEARPDSRVTSLINLDMRQYYPDSALAFLAGYRYFEDDWGLNAHTFDFDWVKTIETHELLWGVRYYSQRAADFYAPFFATTPASGHFSSDYRLADFASVALRLGYAKSFEKSRFQILAERYQAGDVDVLQSRRYVNDHDALVHYWRFSFDMTYTF